MILLEIIHVETKISEHNITTTYFGATASSSLPTIPSPQRDDDLLWCHYEFLLACDIVSST